MSPWARCSIPSGLLTDSTMARTNWTFSCDIAYSSSPTALRGLCSRLKEPPLNDASVAKSHDVRALRFDLYAFPAPEACSVWHHNVLAALDEPVHRDANPIAHRGTRSRTLARPGVRG